VSTLENLTLQGTRITNDGIAHFAGLPRLSYLRLKDNRQLDDRCVGHLVHVRGLVELQLHETSIGADGLDQLVALPALIHLVIDESNATLDRARALSFRMPRCLILIKGWGEMQGGS
jgi:hypothetical protein